MKRLYGAGSPRHDGRMWMKDDACELNATPIAFHDLSHHIDALGYTVIILPIDYCDFDRRAS